jgi:hypothetical protein
LLWPFLDRPASAFHPFLPLATEWQLSNPFRTLARSALVPDETVADTAAMRIFAPLALIGLLGACHPSITRPDQDNFTLHAGRSGIQPFVATLERRFGASADIEDLQFPQSDPSKLFRVDGRGVTVVVNPVPDDRCDPNAPLYSTYKQGEYRIDLVYRTRSADRRQQASKALAEAASEAGHTITTFKEC